VTNFVILAAQRTGSNLLCTLLNSHPEILCHHEIFNPRGIYYAVTHRDNSFDLGSIQERNRDPISFLNRVWGARCGHRCVGFKLTIAQERRILNHVLDCTSTKKIVLRRLNRIKTYVSVQISRRLDEWEVYDPDELVRDRPRIRVDVARLREHIESNERFYRQIGESLRRRRHPFIEVEYESLMTRELHRRLLGFLAVTPADSELTASSIKQNSANLEDLVSNFAEIADALKGTDLEDELHARDH